MTARPVFKEPESYAGLADFPAHCLAAVIDLITYLSRIDRRVVRILCNFE